jgi:hypothetical protein
MIEGYQLKRTKTHSSYYPYKWVFIIPVLQLKINAQGAFLKSRAGIFPFPSREILPLSNCKICRCKDLTGF